MKKTKKVRANSRYNFFSFFVITAVLLFGVIYTGNSLLFRQPDTLRPLALLTVPDPTLIYLPGPYEAAHIESPVLGAETIDPEDIVTYINNERMKHGSPPLRINRTLVQAAQKRADIILKYQNFSHQDPFEHIQLDTVLPLVHYPFRYASENIGMGDTSASAFVTGFMNSPSHKANLLNPALEETGVAIVTGAYQQYYVNIAVQLFAIPATEEQYVGYKKTDIENYKRLLNDIEKQLILTNDRLQNNVGDTEYYEGWQKILIRQREIVTILYNTMLAQQPFIKNMITLIREYNTNWNLVPKQT